MGQIVATEKPVPTKQAGKFGFDMCGKRVIPAVYDTVSTFKECRLAIAKKGNVFFAIDVNGKKVSKDFQRLNYVEDLCIFNGKAVGKDAFSLYDINFNPITPEGQRYNSTNKNILCIYNPNNQVDFVTLAGEKLFSIEAESIDTYETCILIDGNKTISNGSQHFFKDEQMKFCRRYDFQHVDAAYSCGIVAKMGKKVAYFDFEGKNLTGYFDYEHTALFKAKKKHFGDVMKKVKVVDKYVFDGCDMWAYRRNQILKAEKLYPLYPEAVRTKLLAPDNALYSDIVNSMFHEWFAIMQDHSASRKTYDANRLFDHMTQYCYTMPEVYGRLLNARGMESESSGHTAPALRYYEQAEAYGCEEAVANRKHLIKEYKARKREAFLDKLTMVGTVLMEVSSAYLEASSKAADDDSSSSSSTSKSSKNSKKGSTSSHANDCRICLGTGNCQQCNGSGVIVFQSNRRVCEACKGSAGKCHSCKGSGKKK